MPGNCQGLQQSIVSYLSSYWGQGGDGVSKLQGLGLIIYVYGNMLHTNIGEHGWSWRSKSALLPGKQQGPCGHWAPCWRRPTGPLALLSTSWGSCPQSLLLWTCPIGVLEVNRGQRGRRFVCLWFFFFFFQAWLVCMYVFLQDWYQRSSEVDKNQKIKSQSASPRIQLTLFSVLCPLGLKKNPWHWEVCHCSYRITGQKP